MKRYALGCWVANGGDGSANPVFEQSRAIAEQKCDEQAENGEGWGENSATQAVLVVDENGALFLESSEWEDGKMVKNLIKLDEIQEKVKKKK